MVVGEGSGTENVRKLGTEEVLYISHPSAGISEQDMAQFMADPDLASIFPGWQVCPFLQKKRREREALTFRSPPVVSKEVSQEAVTHTADVFPQLTLLGEDGPISQLSLTQETHREGELMG